MGDPLSELRCPGIQNVFLLMLPLPSSLVCAQLGPVQKYQGLASLSDLLCCSKFKMKSSKKKKKKQKTLSFQPSAPSLPETIHSPSSTPQRQTCLFFQRLSLMFVIQSMLFYSESPMAMAMVSPKTQKMLPRIFITTIPKL